MGLGKWIAGGLGWALFGPTGGILGFLAGYAFEKIDPSNFTGQPQTGQSRQAGRSRTHSQNRYRNTGQQRRTTTQGDFRVSLVILTAAVMKADGRVTKPELDYVKSFLLRSFGHAAASEAVKMLRDVLKQNIAIADVSRQIGRNLDNSSKLQLLHYLFGISSADGHNHPNEILIIQTIASYMGVSAHDFSSIKAMFVKDASNGAYSILGLTKSATNDEIKKAYRKMAAENHPDKVSYLGEEVQKSANEKFQKINQAYEAIKKERAFA